MHAMYDIANMMMRINKRGELDEEAGGIILVTEIYLEERQSAVAAATAYDENRIRARGALIDGWQRESERLDMNEMMFTNSYLHEELMADLVKYTMRNRQEYWGSRGKELPVNMEMKNYDISSE